MIEMSIYSLEYYYNPTNYSYFIVFSLFFFFFLICIKKNNSIKIRLLKKDCVAMMHISLRHWNELHIYVYICIHMYIYMKQHVTPNDTISIAKV